MRNGKHNCPNLDSYDLPDEDDIQNPAHHINPKNHVQDNVAGKCLNLDSYDLPDEHDRQCPVHPIIL